MRVVSKCRCPHMGLSTVWGCPPYWVSPEVGPCMEVSTVWAFYLYEVSSIWRGHLHGSVPCMRVSRHANNYDLSIVATMDIPLSCTKTDVSPMR